MPTFEPWCMRVHILVCAKFSTRTLQHPAHFYYNTIPFCTRWSRRRPPRYPPRRASQICVPVFRYCCSWAIFFFNNINCLFWNKILHLFDILVVCILGQTFFKMRSGFCRMHSKLLYKRGTKTNELFWTLFRGAFYFKIVVLPTRAQVWGGLRPLQAGPAGPAPSCRYRPACCMTRQPLWKQSGPSPTMRTQVSIIGIYDSWGLRIK
jgi:hypothetical protein